MVGWHCRLNEYEFEQTLGDGEEQGSLECCSPRALKESDTSERLPNSNDSANWLPSSSAFLFIYFFRFYYYIFLLYNSVWYSQCLFKCLTSFSLPWFLFSPSRCLFSPPSPLLSFQVLPLCSASLFLTFHSLHPGSSPTHPPCSGLFPEDAIFLRCDKQEEDS